MMEREYWNRRYGRGRTSGKGSVGAYRKWKWRIINRYVNTKNKTVLDVGCGDLSFLKGKKPKEYTGIDISPFIIGKNKTKRPDWSFVLTDATIRFPDRFKMDVVLAMDILFHIMDDSRFGDLLKNLNDWTGEWLFINTWAKNPLPVVHDGEYQCFRDLNEWLPLSNLELVGQYPYDDGFNMMYVFRRKKE